MTKVVVRGAAGQLGTLILRRLVQRRKLKEIVAIDREAPLIPSGKIRFIDAKSPQVESAGEGAATIIDVDAHDVRMTFGPSTETLHFRCAMPLGLRMQTSLGRTFLRALAGGVLFDIPLPIVLDEDVAAAVMLALDRDARGTFDLAAPGSESTKDIARALNLRWAPLPKIGSRAGPLSPDRAQSELGWSPQSTIDVFRHLVDNVPGEPALRLRAFFGLLKFATTAMVEGDDEPLKGVTARVHLALTGKGGGDFGFVVDRGRVQVLGHIPRPPTSVATMPASLWVELIEGRANVPTSQFTGKIRIDGDPIAAFVLAGAIARYRRTIDEGGFTGGAARALVRLISRP